MEYTEFSDEFKKSQFSPDMKTARLNFDSSFGAGQSMITHLFSISHLTKQIADTICTLNNHKIRGAENPTYIDLPNNGTSEYVEPPNSIPKTVNTKEPLSESIENPSEVSNKKYDSLSYCEPVFFTKDDFKKSIIVDDNTTNTTTTFNTESNSDIQEKLFQKVSEDNPYEDFKTEEENKEVIESSENEKPTPKIETKEDILKKKDKISNNSLKTDTSSTCFSTPPEKLLLYVLLTEDLDNYTSLNLKTFANDCFMLKTIFEIAIDKNLIPFK